MPTLNLQTAASSDDGFESSTGAVTLTNTFRTISSAGRWLGWRWLDATIPAGSTIASATLQIYIHADSDDVYLDIWGEDCDDAPTFTTDNDNISGRTPTTAKVDWDETGTGGGWQSPATALTAIIQEIIDRPSWASGNDIVVIAETQTGVGMTTRFWDYSGNAYGAKLDITYTEPGGAILRRRIEGC